MYPKIEMCHWVDKQVLEAGHREEYSVSRIINIYKVYCC